MVRMFDTVVWRVVISSGFVCEEAGSVKNI